MATVVGGLQTLAALGQGGVAALFLGLGVGALALGLALRKETRFLAAVAIPGAASGLVGAVVVQSADLSLRWLLIFAPVAAALLFAARREGIVQTALATVTSGVVAAAFYVLGAVVIFFYTCGISCSGAT
jgi:hypothetical protein